jgi:hypothetical protein
MLSAELIHKMLSADRQNFISWYTKCYQLIHKMLSADTMMISADAMMISTDDMMYQIISSKLAIKKSKYFWLSWKKLCPAGRYPEMSCWLYFAYHIITINPFTPWWRCGKEWFCKGFPRTILDHNLKPLLTRRFEWLNLDWLKKCGRKFVYCIHDLIMWIMQFAMSCSLRMAAVSAG